MGEAAGVKGVWAYVEGGMGKLSQCIAESAKGFGAEIVTNAVVKKILYEGNKVTGVEMADGSKIFADTVSHFRAIFCSN
jgi:phytoene dehydrogenase-like protein